VGLYSGHHPDSYFRRWRSDERGELAGAKNTVSTMRQGEREYISTFKTRANEGAVVPILTERKLALDVLSLASQVNAGADITYDQHEIDSLLHRLVAAIATFSAERMYREVRGQSIPAIRSMAARETEHAYVQIVSESSANEKCCKRELAGMRFPSVGDAMDIVNSGTNFG
jgi:hypothetical protein